MKASGGVYPGKVTLEDVNVRPLPNPAWGGKGYGIAALWMLSPLTQYRLGSVWVETGWWNGTVHNGLKSSLGFRDPSLTSPLWSWQELRANGTAYGPEYIAQPGNTGTSLANQQGDWIAFVRPSTDNIWNLAGTGRRACGRRPVRRRLRHRILGAGRVHALACRGRPRPGGSIPVAGLRRYGRRPRCRRRPRPLPNDRAAGRSEPRAR